MKIKYMSCPRCGGALNGAAMNSINYCSYCGAPLHVDDGTKRVHKTTVIRDEARIMEAELASRKLDLEMERMRRKEERAMSRSENFGHAAAFVAGSALKAIVCIIGIILIAIIGLIYLIWPFDFLPGLILDDIGIIALCVYSCICIGKCLNRY